MSLFARAPMQIRFNAFMNGRQSVAVYSHLEVVGSCQQGQANTYDSIKFHVSFLKRGLKVYPSLWNWHLRCKWTKNNMRRLKNPTQPRSRENTVILLCITRRKSGQNEPEIQRMTRVVSCSKVTLSVKVKEVQTRKINEESCAELTSCRKFHSRRQFYAPAAPGLAGRDGDEEAAVNSTRCVNIYWVTGTESVVR